jgi:NAD(P)H-hydrate epimerase
MKVVTSVQMREIDRYTIEELGIPGIVLMENAAMSIVSETIDIVKNSTKVVVCCGIGNNGGDGFAIARILKCNNINVSIVLIGDNTKIKGDAKINYEIANNLNIEIFEYNKIVDNKKLSDIISNCNVIYDAIFGTGIRRDIEGIYYDAINIINKSHAYKIAVDTPSGVDVDNGHIKKIGVYANKTITFCLPKAGLLLFPGAEYVGELVVADIGIPFVSLDRINTNISIMDDFSYRYHMPVRKEMSHKGSYGKILIIAGTHNMIGAAIMSTLAAYRCGAGLVKTFTDKNASTVISSCVPEAIVESYSRENDMLLQEDRKKLIDMIKWADTVAIGPGLSNDSITRELLEIVITNCEKTVVIDADGINALAKDLDILNNKKSQIIITPHIGEMARLTNYNISTISNNTLTVAKEFSKEYDVICVLKSARTIVATPNEEIMINVYGNAGMATAGSGDVLTGIIVSLLGQRVELLNAAKLGVYIHSKAGDKAKNKLGEYSLIANDIIEHIPYVMKLNSSE